MSRSVSPLDTSLLSGFTYACRPDCGLCCFAEPIVSPGERADLLRMIPEAPFVERGREAFVQAAPDGGACRLLSSNRCGGHAARPSICREFPITAHIGSTVQATVVLTCPGVDLSGLDAYHGSASAGAPVGFEGELAALRMRIDPSTDRRHRASVARRSRIARRLSREGRWQEEAEVREILSPHIPMPSATEFPTEDLPDRRGGLERLPLVYLGRRAPVALASDEGGWQLLELRPGGGVAEELGTAPPPEKLPQWTAEAGRLLSGYLRYWLERDSLFGAVHLTMVGGATGTVSEEVAAELRRIGATVLSRAQLLASLVQGTSGPLSRDDVGQGIRATDQDLLDRPTWGTRL